MIKLFGKSYSIRSFGGRTDYREEVKPPLPTRDNVITLRAFAPRQGVKDYSPTLLKAMFLEGWQEREPSIEVYEQFGYDYRETGCTHLFTIAGKDLDLQQLWTHQDDLKYWVWLFQYANPAWRLSTNTAPS